ncbi:MAG: 50S ribosomal protein L29 [bacterium]
MKPSEIREFTDEELLSQEAELERTVFNLRIQYATGQVENTASLKNTRRDLARVKTVLKERKLKS